MAQIKHLPSPRLLRRLIDYCPKTGAMVWEPRPVWMFKSFKRERATAAKIWNSRFANGPALSSRDRHGYPRGHIFGQMHRAHRVAWAIHYGEWPSDEVDHINGNRADNRIGNLRVVSKFKNMRNARRSKANKSGVTGVYRRGDTGKWVAKLMHNRRVVNLGEYDQFEDAVSARKAGERKFGFHPNHGRAA